MMMLSVRSRVLTVIIGAARETGGTLARHIAAMFQRHVRAGENPGDEHECGEK